MLRKRRNISSNFKFKTNVDWNTRAKLRCLFHELKHVSSWLGSRSFCNLQEKIIIRLLFSSSLPQLLSCLLYLILRLLKMVLIDEFIYKKNYSTRSRRNELIANLALRASLTINSCTTWARGITVKCKAGMLVVMGSEHVIALSVLYLAFVFLLYLVSSFIAIFGLDKVRVSISCVSEFMTLSSWKWHRLL